MQIILGIKSNAKKNITCARNKGKTPAELVRKYWWSFTWRPAEKSAPLRGCYQVSSGPQPEAHDAY